MIETKFRPFVDILLGIASLVLVGGCANLQLRYDRSGGGTLSLDGPYIVQSRPCETNAPSIDMGVTVRDARTAFGSPWSPGSFFVYGQAVPVADFVQSSMEKELSHFGILTDPSARMTISGVISDYGVSWVKPFMMVALSGHFEMVVSVRNPDGVLFTTTLQTRIREKGLTPAPAAAIYRRLLEQAMADLFSDAKFQAAVKSISAKSTTDIPARQPTTRIELPTLSWRSENIAVADITAYTLSHGEAKTLTDKLHTMLVQTGYFNVLSRSDMKAVLDAQQFQRTDACDDSACLVEMGKILAVQKIIGGSIGKVGNTYSLAVRLVNVETGKTEITTDRKLKAEPDQLLDLIEDAGRELALKYSETRAKQ